LHRPASTCRARSSARCLKVIAEESKDERTVDGAW
jgi:hypothetical protein